MPALSVAPNRLDFWLSVCYNRAVKGLFSGSKPARTVDSVHRGQHPTNERQTLVMAELPARVASVETFLAPHLAVPALPFDADLLAGQLADSSIAMYRRDFKAYGRFAATQALDLLQPATLARWRTTLSKETALSPNTINRMLSAVKRLMAEAAEQGYLDHEVAEAFQDLKGVKRAALKARLK